MQMMTTPSHNPLNQGELELYRVLQRANLLQYYDTFISQGGDDVQQLCEAGEEEFLEIMALVGMAAKPLHVRRLQKALQEWVANPALFCQPLTNSCPVTAASTTTTTSTQKGVITIATETQQTPCLPTSTSTPSMPSPGTSGSSSGTVTAPTWMPLSSASEGKSFTSVMSIMPSTGSIKEELTEKPSSPMPQLTLLDSQIAAIEECAKDLVKTLPPYSPKPLSLKKQINQDIMNLINMDYDDPSRMDEIRKYSAIYGRFDSKRKNLKPMSLHEICVNEAAAQICRYIPNLLTRRDELFPLARQVVRDSGYQYSKGHSRTADSIPQPGKKPLLPLGAGQLSTKIDDLDNAQIHPVLPSNMNGLINSAKARLLAERMTEITQELSAIMQQQELVKTKISELKDEKNPTLTQDLQAEFDSLSNKQLHLLTEQSQLIKSQRRAERYFTMKGANENGDGTDSMHSGASSPLSSSVSEEVDFKQNDVYIVPPKKSATKTKVFVQKSLFDEGLRIAQQYGMADFAEEIADMKGLKKDDDRECDDEVDSYTNEFTPVRIKKESSDEEEEKSYNHGLKRSSEESEQFVARKYPCGPGGLRVEKLKHLNSGDESLYHSEESCDSRPGSESHKQYDHEYTSGANNNLKSDVVLQTGHVIRESP